MAADGSNGAAAAVVVAAGLHVPEWVHTALAGVVDKKGWKKPKFHIENGSSDGDGYLSVLYRVLGNNEDDGDQLRLMCKTTTTTVEVSPWFGHIFKTEGFVYNRVLPLMEELAQLKEPLPWPRGYPNESKPPCLVMEDLRPSGFSICKRGTVLTDKHCRLFVSAIARFHGAGLAIAKLRPDFIDEFRQTTENPAALADFKKMFDLLLTAASKTPPMLAHRFPEGSAVMDYLKQHFANVTTDFYEYLKPDPEGGNALVHGDCHVNNVMFQHDEDGEATGCRLMDFQSTRYAWPTPDLVGVLLTVTEKPTRDAHWHDWMRQYHAEVQATMRAAGVQDPDDVYSWELFQRHLKRACQMILCTVPILVHGLTELEAIKEIQEAVAQVTGAAGDGAASPQLNFKPTATLKRRFGDVVDNLAEWGLLL